MTLGDTLWHLGRSTGDDPRTDGELLTLFVRQRDEAAFAELLRRHGPTVLGVCRRILGNSHDADDAFQGAFLVLARKADTVRPPGMVGNWLYGVAVRTANKARVMNAKRKAREAAAGTQSASDGVGSGTRSASDGVMELIDAELSSLPDVYRAAFVACDLNGRSRSEAARELGWPEGTVAARLAKARELLAGKLRKRGVTLTAGALSAVLVPPALAADTLGAVRELAAVGAANAVAPAAQQLSDEVVKAMTPFNWKLIAVGVATVTLAAGTAALIAAPGERPGPRPERKPMTNAPVPKDAAVEWKEAKPIELKDGARITGVAYSPNGKSIAVAQDKRVEVLKADTLRRLFAIENIEPATFPSVAFSPTGDKMAVSRNDAVDVCDATTGKGIESWEMAGFDPHQVAWLRNAAGDERLAATNGKEARVRLTDAGRGGPEMIAHNWAGYEHRPSVLAPVPGEDKVLFTVNTQMKRVEDDPCDVWVRSLIDSSLSTKLSGHKARPTCGAVAKDGKRVVTADEGGTLIVWEGEKFEEKRRIELGEGVEQLTLAADGKTVAVLRKIQSSSTTPPANAADGWSVSVTTTKRDFELFVFDATSLAKPKPIWKTEKPFAGPLDGPASLAFSPDGKTLLAAFADPYIADNDAKSTGVKVWELVPKK